MNHYRGLRGAEKAASGSGNHRFLSDFDPSENPFGGKTRGNLPRHRRALRRVPTRNLRHRNPPLHDQRQNGNRRSPSSVSHRYRNRQTRDTARGVLTPAGEKEHLRQRTGTENPSAERLENGFQARRNPQTRRRGGRHSHSLRGIARETPENIKSDLSNSFP